MEQEQRGSRQLQYSGEERREAQHAYQGENRRRTSVDTPPANDPDRGKPALQEPDPETG